MSTGLVFSVLIRRSDVDDDDENFSTPLHFFSDPETLNIDRSNKSKENSKILLLLLSYIYTTTTTTTTTTTEIQQKCRRI